VLLTTLDKMKVPESLKLTIIGVFAALTIILDIVPLPSVGYVNLAAVIETIAAIVASTGILGGIGVTVGSLIYSLYHPSELFLYGGFLTMASGAISIALMMYRRYEITILAVILLVLFFIAPGDVYVPIWALWDKYLALILIFPAVYLVKKTFKKELNKKYLLFTVFLLSFVGLEMDAMMGNLLFGLYGYSLLGLTPKGVADLYVPFALVAVWERLIVAFISTLITVPLVIAIDSNPRIRWLIYRG